MKCVSGIDVLPLLAVVHRVWRWWSICRIRRDWCERQDLQRLARKKGWEIVRREIPFDYNYRMIKLRARLVPGRVNEI